MEDITRRKFLQGALLAGTGAAAAGALVACSPAAPGSPADTGGTTDADGTGLGIASGSGVGNDGTGALTWLPAEPQISDADVEEEVECDVIVVGLGVAGVAAARAASEKGAKVVAFEKGSGPQCRSGEYAVINGDLMARWWGKDNVDADAVVDHEMDECAYMPKRSIWSKWAKGSAEVFAWYIGAKEDLFICDSYLQDVPDENAEAYLVPLYFPNPEHYEWKGDGSYKFQQYPTSVGLLPSQAPVLEANMVKAVDENGAVPYYGHFVEKLIMADGRCVGCYARNAETGKYVKTNAAKGVVLATGDNSGNQAIMDYYCPELRENGTQAVWMNMDVEGNPTNTGDGLKLGAYVNAAIQQHHAPMTHWPCFSPETFSDQTMMGSAPYLLLNKDGKRFANEETLGQQMEAQVEIQRDRTVFQIFDSAWFQQLPYFPSTHGSRFYVLDALPKNNSAGMGISQAQIDAGVEAGFCKRADTLEALFDQFDIDKDTALASIERYNQLAKAGHDEDFDKTPGLMFPLENPPYYMSEATVAVMLVCIGGLESDEDAHVYDNDRRVIPGLYAAGNIQGNRFAIAYPIALAGVSHSMALYYGYVAGQNAAAGL